MNAIIILLGLLAFSGGLPALGMGKVKNTNGKDTGLQGYSGFAYFPLFGNALPMPETTPLVWRTAQTRWSDILAQMKPNEYYLLQGSSYFDEEGTLYVIERIGGDVSRANQYSRLWQIHPNLTNVVRNVGVYNPDLRVEVANGVQVIAEESA